MADMVAVKDIVAQYLPVMEERRHAAGSRENIRERLHGTRPFPHYLFYEWQKARLVAKIAPAGYANCPDLHMGQTGKTQFDIIYAPGMQELTGIEFTVAEYANLFQPEKICAVRMTEWRPRSYIYHGKSKFFHIMPAYS